MPGGAGWGNGMGGWARGERAAAALVVAVAALAASGGAHPDPAEARSFALTEFPTPAGMTKLSGMTAGPDGRLWFRRDGGFGAITTSGTVSSYTLGFTPQAFVAGPDGAFWTITDDLTLWRVTTTGQQSARGRLPDHGPEVDAPGGLTLGPDGALWYTRIPGIVGRVTFDGVATEYPIPLPDPFFSSRPVRITTGPDGALWFTENWGDRIGRVTIDGAITMHPLPEGLRAPSEIVTGPDGNLWFTMQDSEAGDLGRITPGGEVTDFDVPVSLSTLGIGPDGALWALGEDLWRIAADGGAVRHPLGGWGGQLAVGPDGNMWFTLDDPIDAWDVPKVVRLSLADDPRGEFTGVTPQRILDTRSGEGRGGSVSPLGPGATIDVQVTGRAGVPTTGVSAVVLNTTAVTPIAASFVTVWPAGGARPGTSNLNLVPGRTAPNLVTVKVGSGGRVSAYNAAGATDLLMDVVGYYADSAGPFGSRFLGVTPARLFDTRSGTGGVPATPLGPGGVARVDVTGRAGIPATGVTGVVMNVTVTQPSVGGWLTVYPDDVAPPEASNLNFVAGETVPNLVTVRVPPSGIVALRNAAGTTHVLADVVGYYTTEVTTNAGRFVALTPERIYDTRSGQQGYIPVPPLSRAEVLVRGTGNVPGIGPASAVFNVTAVEPEAGGWFTVMPGDACEVPDTSSVNFVAGQTVPNQAISSLSGPYVGCAGFNDLAVANRSWGRAHVVVDVFGYFTGDALTPVPP